jgi:hypothetical protein
MPIYIDKWSESHLEVKLSLVKWVLEMSPSEARALQGFSTTSDWKVRLTALRSLDRTRLTLATGAEVKGDVRPESPSKSLVIPRCSFMQGYRRTESG